MKKIIRFFFRIIRKCTCPKVIKGEAANTIIIKILQSNKPIMAARLGSVEAQTILWSILPPH